MRLTAILFSFIVGIGMCASHTFAGDLSPNALFKRLIALEATGNADVKYHLGMFLNNGIGIPQDNSVAFRYFLEAAGAGSELASYKVGCYYAGQFPGVIPRDEENALKFKLQAAEAGYDLAQQDVGIYFWRRGDTARALNWWERASRQANIPATAYLASYFTSDSSPDKIKGLALMRVLRESMSKPERELSDRIAAVESQLSRPESMEADRIRSSWVDVPTPLTAEARSGMSAVPALLTSLEK